MRYPVIFFDLDGTLTDPTEGITRSVQYALSKFDIAAELDDLRSFIGPPLHHSFMNVYGFDEPTARLAVDRYREYFGDQGIYENQLFEGIPQLLQSLSAAGCVLSVVTSKPTVYSQRIVDHFGLAPFFDAIVGPNLDLSNADKPGLVKQAMSHHTKRQTTDFVMIGDREHDVLGGHANRIDSVGVTYGAGTREELTAASATHVIDTLTELELLLLG
jgi:phosphoglycolate phosphatase